MSNDFYLECEHCNSTIFKVNFTHNYREMADKAGIYEVLWHPKKGLRAKKIIKTIEMGLADLVNRPEYFKQFNPSNGWGDYDSFVPKVNDVLESCKKFPKAIVRADV